MNDVKTLCIEYFNVAKQKMTKQELSAYYNNLRKIMVVCGGWIQSHPLASSFVYTTFYLLIVVCFSHINWENSDDFTISMLLFGSFGECSYFTLVSNYFYNVILVKLFTIIPFVNWFGFMDLLSVYLTFIVLNYLFFKNIKSFLSGVVFFFSPLFEVDFLVKLHYTRSAILISFVGILVLYNAFSVEAQTEKKCKKGLFNLKKSLQIIAAVCMMTIGSLIRYDCLYLGLSFGIIIIVSDYLAKKTIKFDKVSIIRVAKKSIPIFIILSCLILSSMLIKAKSDSIINSNEAIQSYRRFNSARANVHDYLPKNFTPISDSDFYLTENDFNLLQYNIIYDSYFNEDYWIKAKDYLIQYSKSESFITINGIKEKLDSLKYYNQGRYSGRRSLLQFYLIFIVLSILGINRKNLFSTCLAIVFTLAVIIYFVAGGRFPPWVADPVYVMGSTALLYSIIRNPIDCKGILSSIKTCLIYILLVLLLFCAVFRAIQIKRLYFYNEDFQNVLNYAIDDKEDIFLLDSVVYMPYPAVDLYGPIKAIPKGDWSNIIRVGNWDIKHPVKNRQLEELGIESPISSLVDDNVYLICSTDKGQNEVKQLANDLKATSNNLNNIADRLKSISEKSSNSTADMDNSSDDYSEISGCYDCLSDEFKKMSKEYNKLSELFNSVSYEFDDDLLDDVQKYQIFFEEHYGIQNLDCKVVFESGNWCIVKLSPISNENVVHVRYDVD